MDHPGRPRTFPPQAPSTFTPPSADASHPLSDPHQDLDRSDPNIGFTKGPKRKRLAKACDACHKSKRRCDGTAPCSNCYFASKKCTYTDASGKPVPAPRPFHPDRQENSADVRSDSYPPHPDGASTSSPSIASVQANDAPPSMSPPEDDRAYNPRTKRFRTNHGDTSTPSSTPPRPLAPAIRPERPLQRDHALTRELVHLFFAYRQPQRMIIHQPSFLKALSHGAVPQRLLLAVCAVAAPLSKQPRLMTSPCRYAGEAFAQEAASLMFDKNHQLVCEHNLATAQALLLLQLFDRMGKSLWVGQHYQLALEIVSKLGIFDTDGTVLTPHPSPELIDACIERECARRVFWLIFISDCFGWMLYRRPRLAPDSQLSLRLPMDETSFEVSPLISIPEFITKPTQSFTMCSESGQMIRLLLLHEETEKLIDDLNEYENGRYLIDRLQDIERKVGEWSDALPEHMRFTEDNLWVHVMQYDTESNMGAWCFFIIHVVHCSCVLAFHLGRQRCRLESSPNPTWAKGRILKIIDVLGRKAKLSIFLGIAVWPLFKYLHEPPSQALLNWSSDFEEIWGVRMQDLSERQQLRAHPAPPPPAPVPMGRISVSGTPPGSMSPVSQMGSEICPSSAAQPSHNSQARVPHDASVHSLSSSHSESRAQIGHDVREKEVRNVINDANIDPALQVTSDARLQAPSQWPAPAPPLSLPSLKASGLLEWPHPGSTDAAVAPPAIQSGVNWQQPPQNILPPCQPQRDSIRPPNVQTTSDGFRAPAPSSSMPVGLQWLAHESSVPRPS